MAKTSPRSIAVRKVTTNEGVMLTLRLTYVRNLSSRYRFLDRRIPSDILLFCCILEKIMRYWNPSRIVVRDWGYVISIRLNKPSVWIDIMK